MRSEGFTTPGRWEGRNGSMDMVKYNNCRNTRPTETLHERYVSKDGKAFAPYRDIRGTGLDVILRAGNNQCNGCLLT